MDDEQIMEMIKDIVGELDYDHYKLLFVEDCMEDPDAAMSARDRLLFVAKRHLDGLHKS